MKVEDDRHQSWTLYGGQSVSALLDEQEVAGSDAEVHGILENVVLVVAAEGQATLVVYLSLEDMNTIGALGLEEVVAEVVQRRHLSFQVSVVEMASPVLLLQQFV